MLCKEKMSTSHINVWAKESASNDDPDPSVFDLKPVHNPGQLR